MNDWLSRQEKVKIYTVVKDNMLKIQAWESLGHGSTLKYQFKYGQIQEDWL